MTFYSIDLHLDSFLATKLSFDEEAEQGKIQTTKYYLDEASFQNFKTQLEITDYLIVESCTNAFWFYDQIKDLVKKCFVLDVNKFKQNINKTDKIDGKKLVKKLAYFIMANGDQDDLPTVFIPSVQIREIRGLFSTYQLNKKTTTQFKNRVHSILKQNGIVVSRKGISEKPAFRTKLLTLPLSQVWKIQIQTLLKQIGF